MKNKTLNIRTTEQVIYNLNELQKIYLEINGTKKSQAQIIEELIYKEYKEVCKNKQLKMQI